MNKNEIIVTTITNPFNGDKTIKQVPCTGEPVFNYLPVTDEKIAIIHNGHIVLEEQLGELCPKSGDSIVIRPVISGGGNDNVGKALLEVVATVALIIALPYAAAGWATTAMGGAMLGGFSVWGWMAYAVTYAAGAWAINQLFPKNQDQNSDPNYSWGGLQAMQGQGNPMQIVYGSVRTAGQIITQHITTDGDKSYLNALLCGGEGEIDSITGIQINGTPIDSFPGVSYAVRLGTNDQAIIPGFGDTYSDQFFNLELEEGVWNSYTTEGNGGTGLEIAIDFPSGLWHFTNGYSEKESTTVKIKAQYCIEGGPWVDWAEWTISDKQESSFRKTYRIDGLAPGRYTARVQCSYKAGNDSYYNIKPYWTCLSHIVYDDFCRPGKVLLGIQALATDQLSGGMPQITWIQTLRNVWVWNTISGQYEQKPADNPAWACYDLLHRCKRLKDIHTGLYSFVVRGVAASRIDYQAFLNWANYCDEIVDGVDLFLPFTPGFRLGISSRLYIPLSI